MEVLFNEKMHHPGPDPDPGIVSDGICIPELNSLSDAQSQELMDEYQILSEKIGGGRDTVVLYQKKQQVLWDVYKSGNDSAEGYKWELDALRKQYTDSLAGTITFQIRQDELWKDFIGGKIHIDEYNAELQSVRTEYAEMQSVVEEYKSKEEALWETYTGGGLSVDEYNDKLLALRTEYCFNRWSPADLAVMQTRQAEIQQTLNNASGDLTAAAYTETKAVNQGYTLDQLQREYLAILEAMWKTEEWQSVEVPAGVYQVGVEIPAGEWTLSNSDWFSVQVGTKLDATKTEIESSNRTVHELIYMENYKNGWTVELTNGDFIVINKVIYFSVPVKGQGFIFK